MKLLERHFEDRGSSWHTFREIKRKWVVGRLELTFNWRHPESPMGRFGGGWQWEVGLQVSGSARTWIFNLLFCSVRVYWRPEDEE